jgi:hypothetical protein
VFWAVTVRGKGVPPGEEPLAGQVVPATDRIDSRCPVRLTGTARGRPKGAGVVTDATRYAGSTFEALAELAAVLADPERRKNFKTDPQGAVPSFDRLPEDMQSTLTRMEDGELEAIGKLHQMLLDNNSFVQSGRLQLSMF